MSHLRTKNFNSRLISDRFQGNCLCNFLLKVATTHLQNSLFLGDGSVIIALTTNSVIFSFIIYLLPFTTRIDNRTNACGYMWIGIYYFSLFLTNTINFWAAINHMKKINQLITLISMQWMEEWAYIHILEVQTAFSSAQFKRL